MNLTAKLIHHYKFNYEDGDKMLVVDDETGEELYQSWECYWRTDSPPYRARDREVDPVMFLLGAIENMVRDRLEEDGN